MVPMIIPPNAGPRAIPTDTTHIAPFWADGVIWGYGVGEPFDVASEEWQSQTQKRDSIRM